MRWRRSPVGGGHPGPDWTAGHDYDWVPPGGPRHTGVSHFEVHRWHQTGPRLSALLVPPAHGPTTALADRVARRLARDPALQVIPAQWRHVTLATLAEQPVPQHRVDALAAWLTDAVAIAAGSAARPGHRPAYPSRISSHGLRIGATGISQSVSGHALAAYRGLLAHAATAAGVLADPTQVRAPATPHLGLAYSRHEFAADAVRARIPTRLVTRTAWWEPAHIVLVDLRQDERAGCYTWTVRAQIPLIPF